MNTLAIKISYRPLRLGWCLETGDLDSLEKALRLSHALWGGRFNPIIPVDNPELAAMLVKLFRVDALYPMTDTGMVKAFVSQYPYIPWPLFESGIFLKGRGKTHAQMLDIYHPVSFLYQNKVQNNPGSTFRATIFEWGKNDALRIPFLASFGDLTPAPFPKGLSASTGTSLVNSRGTIRQPSAPGSRPSMRRWGKRS